jgi:hypothetical protein
MKDIRQELFWHPQLGVLEKVSEDGTCRLSNANTFINMQSPMETVYERDRRLWVEQLLNRKIADFTLSIDAFDTERWTVRAMAVYDKIQEVNFSFNQ